MKNSYIKKFLSAALLLTFSASSGISYPVYSGTTSDTMLVAATSTSLVTNTQLSDDNAKITLSLRDSDVKQVLRMFADKANKNIVFHSGVSGSVTLDLVDMPLNDAFSLVLQISNLNYYVKDKTLIIVPKDSSDNANFSKQEMMVFPINYVSASKIANFLNKNVFGMKRVGLSGGDAATVNAVTNELIVFGMPSDAIIVKKVIEQLDREPLTKTFIVNHTTPAEMASMLCNLLLPAHGVSTGGGNASGNGDKDNGSMTGGAAFEGGGSEGSAENTASIKLGEGVVACSISQSSNGTILPFDVQNIAIAYYPQRGSLMMIGGSEAQVNMVENFIKANDIKQPQAYLEMQIVELTEAGSKEFQNNWSVQSKNWGVTFNNGTLSGGRDSGPDGRYSPVTEHRWFETTNPETGEKDLVYKAVDGYKQTIKGSSYISWQMNYLIQNKKGRMLANPKLIITNGQESVIDMTEDYVEKVTSEFMSSGASTTIGAVQKTYDIKDDKGLKISLVPFISPDGYVTLNIKPNYATEASREYTQSVTGDGQDLAATLLNRRNLDIKNVRIKDGETLIIGGMINEQDNKTVNKIPVLGDLPLIGSAFRSVSSVKSKSELVLMITPRIIHDENTVADSL